MELGRTCILLNMEQLYESLYDALNQYYSYMGAAKFVDLGLGAHRVKCRVHDAFKLIIIATKELAYKFPPPLINRLEKHLFSLVNILTADERRLLSLLDGWVMKYVRANNNESGLLKSSETWEAENRSLLASSKAELAQNRRDVTEPQPEGIRKTLTFGSLIYHLSNWPVNFN